jgi:hypothetical protein
MGTRPWRRAAADHARHKKLETTRGYDQRELFVVFCHLLLTAGRVRKLRQKKPAHLAPPRLRKGLEGIVSKRMTSRYKSGTYMFVPARTAADVDINVRLYPDCDHNGAENGDWANVLLSDASRVLGLEPLAAFAVEWEDEDEEAATV